ncbi:MAG TPA: RHS repeat-associated core domain-containing protein, partial [Terriglobales bacterium]|nr:RHS repeat-associated core domain-containing protein [Terriglobales bacterium]
VVDADGKPFDEYAPGLARVTGGFFDYEANKAEFNYLDHLGTPRLSTDYTGAVVRTEGVLMGPFGDNFTETNTSLDFTGFAGGFWDSENNGEHFGAREYENTHGSWLSPDPAGLAAADPSNPQTWNLYAYVMNNPLSLVDPSGLEGVNQQWGGLPSMLCDTDTCPSFIVNGLRASASVALRLLASGGGAICPRCGDPFRPMWVGADDKVYAWNAGTRTGMFVKSGDFTMGTTTGFWQKVGTAWHYLDDTLGITGPSASFRHACASAGMSAGAEGCYSASVPLQSGNTRTVSKQTADKLNELFEKDLNRRDWGRALEDLKRFNELPNDFHGNIMSDGTFVGEVEGVVTNFGSIVEFLP